MSSSSHSEIEKHDGGDSHPQQNRRRSVWLIVAAVITGCVLALALGLGLGLGLHRNKQHSATSSTFVSRDRIFDPSQLVLNSTWNRSAAPQDRVYNFTLTEITSDAAGGAVKQMRVVNGISPGPLIEANVGDTVVVHVDNRMSVPTALHWHGQYQRGSNFMDGTAGVTECGIAPGTQFTYRWTVQQSGTYWWHSHYGPTYADGLFGPLILHGEDEAVRYGANTTATSYDDDHIFVVNDAYQADSFTVAATARSQSGPDGTQGDEPTPDYAMVNGLGFNNASHSAAYNFTVAAQRRVRMRVINAGSIASFRFSVDGHNMTVVEADGTEIEPVVVQSLTVMTAQRYSVLITTDRAPGAYAVRAEVLDDMFAYDNPDLVMDQYAIMRYSGTPASAQPLANVTLANTNVTETLDASTLVPRMAVDPPASNQTTKLVVNFGLDVESNWHAFFNQSTFTSEMAPVASLLQAHNASAAYAPSDELVVTNNDVVVMDVIVNNLDEGSHPFHLHGYTPFLLGSGAGNYQGQLVGKEFRNPMRRDVFSVEPYSWLAFRFVADNPGIWAFHCHLMPHMAIGLLMQFQVLPAQIATLAVPTAQMLPQCDAVRSWVSANTNLLTHT